MPTKHKCRVPRADRARPGSGWVRFGRIRFSGIELTWTTAVFCRQPTPCAKQDGPWGRNGAQSSKPPYLGQAQTAPTKCRAECPKDLVPSFARCLGPRKLGQFDRVSELRERELRLRI